MKKIFFPGIFDILHVGHLEALEYASDFGHLVVGVPTDDVVEEDKGVPPVIPLLERIRILESLKCVHRCILYTELEFLHPMRIIRPYFLAVSEKTWGNQPRHLEAEEYIENKGGHMIRVPHYEEQSSTLIRNRVLELYGQSQS